jgi:hypothetical protein
MPETTSVDVLASQRKTLVEVEFKTGAQEGQFRAHFSTLNKVDSDADVTFPGAFPDGKQVPISAYGHQSWMGALPVGKGAVKSDEETAWVDGAFFLDTSAGRDTYQTVKQLGGLQEWSYGYQPLEYSIDPKELEPFPGAQRILKRLDVYEVSPVLKGAGVGTRTDYVKATLAEHAERVLADAQAFTARTRSLAGLRAKEGRALSAASRDRLTGLKEALQMAVSELDDLLSSVTDEGKSPSSQAVMKAFLGYQKLQADLRAAGITT